MSFLILLVTALGIGFVVKAIYGNRSSESIQDEIEDEPAMKFDPILKVGIPKPGDSDFI
ncbi:hypothetical protein LJR129_005002 [Acidovorax sp. LjRoot129]|uniref:hypothetical protein n=1 Tax=Acidovorax sp. LjRoot129 TaxID=3342260 RepID=UPI003ED173C4